MMKRFERMGVVGLLHLLFCIGSLPGEEPQVSPEELFEQRIMPIFNSSEPSSCIQCHLSAVDLKDYILPSHTETFLALRDQGLINVERPRDSKILNLIAMGEKDSDKLARRIHEKMRLAEYEAFASWIEACCADKSLSSLPKSDRQLKTKPDELIRYNRKNRVLDSFVRNIWSQRMRCFPCHTPAELDSSNPQHVKPIERHAEFVKQYGQRMNIFRESPEATLRQLLVASRKQHGSDFPLLNFEDPENSLLILKPTAKLPPKGEDGKLMPPSSAAPVSHMGGLKMHRNDQSYKAFVQWVQDYAKVAQGKYQSVGELPEDNWFPTQYVLRLKNAPADWENLRGVQLFVHAASADGSGWNSDPIAFTQGLVTPRKIVNGGLFLLASPNELKEWKNSQATLAAGDYLVKVYYDRQAALDSDPLCILEQDDFVGQTVISANWQEGFKNATVFDGGDLER